MPAVLVVPLSACGLSPEALHCGCKVGVGLRRGWGQYGLVLVRNHKRVLRK